jgi:hypothetical protein
MAKDICAQSQCRCELYLADYGIIAAGYSTARKVRSGRGERDYFVGMG